jgi:hypothetical protein
MEGACVTALDGGHVCGPIQYCPVPGRPFLVGGAPRVAAVACRRDWSSELRPNLAGLGAGECARLGEHWLEVALMEHASIAAFARFALDLLALGAPPDFVLSAHQAMADETAHARDAFALASAYLGRKVGPGRLELGSPEERSPREIVRTTVLEGCIGETMAAAEAAEALATATDPAVREALSRIVRDETAHAALAWRFLAWALQSPNGDVSSAAAAELAHLAAANASGDIAVARATRVTGRLATHGMLDDLARRDVARQALQQVAGPCARELLRAARSTQLPPDTYLNSL